MDVLEFFVFIFAIMIFMTAYWYLTVPMNLPPGSAGVPILGYMPFLNPYIYLLFTELGKKYGNVFHLYLGSQLIVVLNDFAAIKEAYVKHGDKFSGRNPDPDMDEISGEVQGLGILMTDGEFWRQHRRFIIHKLKDYGVGKASIEPLLLDEIHHLLKKIKEKNGDTVEIKSFLSPSLANNIRILVAGERLDYEDPAMHAINNSLRDGEMIAALTPLKTFFPWAKHIIDLVYPKRNREIKKFQDRLTNVVKAAIIDVSNTFADGETSNYLQAYLTERNNRLKVNEKEDIFTESGIIFNTQDLLMAGTDTIASTLAWAALYMALHPDVQKRVQREIDDVIGRHREPSYADRINTPYTEATINELHRVISLAPVGFPHRATQDANLFGYRIPKGTTVFANFWAVHHDVMLWGDPENFRPERFIGPKGECLRPEYLLPFSIGKRACAGEPLARMELYLYFVSLLQHFDFVSPQDVKLTLNAKRGFTRQPESLLICFKQRS